MRVALLEDEPAQATLLQAWLREAGMEAVHWAEAAPFRREFPSAGADLVILDWILPEDSGLEVLKWMRRAVSTTLPVIMVTNRVDSASLVEGLDAGADDYLAKPVVREELLARLRALTRRASPGQSDSPIHCGRITLLRSERRALVGKDPVELTDKEFELACLLLESPGKLHLRTLLQERVWGGADVDVKTRSLDTHISRLRSKLALVPEHSFDLGNVYGKGYRLRVLPDRHSGSPKPA